MVAAGGAARQFHGALGDARRGGGHRGGHTAVGDGHDCERVAVDADHHCVGREPALPGADFVGHQRHGVGQAEDAVKAVGEIGAGGQQLRACAGVVPRRAQMVPRHVGMASEDVERGAHPAAAAHRVTRAVASSHDEDAPPSGQLRRQKLAGDVRGLGQFARRGEEGVREFAVDQRDDGQTVVEQLFHQRQVIRHGDQRVQLQRQQLLHHGDQAVLVILVIAQIHIDEFDGRQALLAFLHGVKERRVQGRRAADAPNGFTDFYPIGIEGAHL